MNSIGKLALFASLFSALFSTPSVSKDKQLLPKAKMHGEWVCTDYSTLYDLEFNDSTFSLGNRARFATIDFSYCFYTRTGTWRSIDSIIILKYTDNCYSNQDMFDTMIVDSIRDNRIYFRDQYCRKQ